MGSYEIVRMGGKGQIVICEDNSNDGRTYQRQPLPTASPKSPDEYSFQYGQRIWYGGTSAPKPGDAPITVWLEVFGADSESENPNLLRFAVSHETQENTINPRIQVQGYLVKLELSPDETMRIFDVASLLLKDRAQGVGELRNLVKEGILLKDPSIADEKDTFAMKTSDPFLKDLSKFGSAIREMWNRVPNK